MQRLARPIVPRPRTRSVGSARDHKQAAMHLVRLEFEINRLQRALATDRQRVALHESELAVQRSERAKLMAILSDEGKGHV